MNELLDKLKTWEADTNSDIKAEWTEPEQKSELLRQSMALSMAIGLLQSIGENNNIPK